MQSANSSNDQRSLIAGVNVSDALFDCLGLNCDYADNDLLYRKICHFSDSTVLQDDFTIQRSASIFESRTRSNPSTLPTSFMIVSWTLQLTTYRNQSTRSLVIMDQWLLISPTLLNTSVCISTASFRGTTMLTPSPRKPAALYGSWTEILHTALSALVTSKNIVIRHMLDCNSATRICLRCLYSLEPTYHQSQQQKIGDGPMICS